MPRQVARATLTIRDAADMSEAERKALATWLRRQAMALVLEGHSYAPQYRARYLYDVEDDINNAYR